MNENLMATLEVARLLGVSRATIDKMRKAGRVPCVCLQAQGKKRPIVRFDREAIRQFVAGGVTDA